jgi:hypothetical protein
MLTRRCVVSGVADAGIGRDSKNLFDAVLGGVPQLDPIREFVMLGRSEFMGDGILVVVSRLVLRSKAVQIARISQIGCECR